MGWGSHFRHEQFRLKIMKIFGFYFLVFFFLYLMCLFTIGVAGELDFLLPFSIIYLVSISICYPFFEMVRRILSQ